MKRFAFVFIAAMFLIGCGDLENQRATNSNSEIENNSSEAILSSNNQVHALTAEQTRRLDQRIPAKIREILDRAEEITISYNVDKNTRLLKVLVSEVPNSNVNVSDPLKKQFLESFYSDAASNSNGSACFSPRHKVSAKYKTETVELNICYECDNFRGKSSSEEFGGGLDAQSKSSAVLDAIIEKYRTKIK
ncbi:MAG TPA: hypothetical protein VK468_01870 [Pyrinomonadaceae bacterium]|nr:hypothetical protein [Pyrinomonadaceae bacterium]